MKFPSSDVHGPRDRGTSLIEVVVAVVLFGILTSTVLAIVLQTQASTVNNRARVAASNLAAREVDYVREQFMKSEQGPLDLMTAGTVINPHSFGAAGSALVVDGKPYTVKRSVAWNVTGSAASACEGGSLVKYPTMNVRVEVTWPSMGQTKPVVNTTNLAPPKGVGLSTTTSYVAVKVTNAAGRPNPGRTVTVFSTGESRSGTTDDAGCAVVEVRPKTGTTGTSYSVRLSDPGHVDMAGNAAPTRLVGNVTQGQLNSSIDMAYDRAASLQLTVVGGDVVDADVAGSSLSVYQSVFQGSSGLTSHVLSGVRTTIGGLWPTTYGAFYGTTAPSSYPSVVLTPGGTGRLDVPIILAQGSITGAPAGTTILAMRPGVTDCAAPGAIAVDPAGFELVPGSWSFAAQSDLVGCSPGPAAVNLSAGGATEVVWKPSTLTITKAPADQGPLWAVPAHAADAACLPADPEGAAVIIGAGPTATVTLPAGDWYVFAAQDAGGRPATDQPCSSTGLVAVPYGADTTFTWTGPGAQP